MSKEVMLNLYPIAIIVAAIIAYLANKYNWKLPNFL
jgi:hypothetical protein